MPTFILRYAFDGGRREVSYSTAASSKSSIMLIYTYFKVQILLQAMSRTKKLRQ